jgi:RNase P/RNase MRP subunit p29
MRKSPIEKTKSIENIETIGKNICIEDSLNKTLMGINGKVMLETKNTFHIKTKNKIIKTLKSCSTFNINNQTINGRAMIKRPEERKNPITL